MNYSSLFWLISCVNIVYGLPLSTQSQEDLLPRNSLKVQVASEIGYSPGFGDFEIVQDGRISLGDILPTEKSLGTFLDALLKFPDLARVVYKVDSEVTIVAPVNSAFQKYRITEHFDDLHEIVASHIIPRKLSEELWQEVTVLPTLNQNLSIQVKIENGTLLLNNKAVLLPGARKATNGYLYKTDEVFP